MIVEATPIPEFIPRGALVVVQHLSEYHALREVVQNLNIHKLEQVGILPGDAAVVLGMLDMLYEAVSSVADV